MANSVGERLLALLQRRLVESLHDAVNEMLGDIGALSPDPAFAGTPFEGRVLTPVTPGGDSLLGRVAGLVSAGGEIALHGWRDQPADDAPRGIAYVVRLGSGVLAVSLVPAQGLTLRAVVPAGGSLDIVLGNGFAAKISARTAGELQVVLAADGSPTVTNAEADDFVEAEFSRTGHGDPLGVPGGPSVVFGACTVHGRLDYTGVELRRGAGLTLAGGEVALAPDFIAGLLPFDGTFPLDVSLTAEPGAGIALEGSPSLRVRLKGRDNWLDVALDLADENTLRVSALTKVDGNLPGVPVGIDVDGVGLSFGIPLTGKDFLVPAPTVDVVPLSGAGVSLGLPVVQGSGTLARSGNDLAGVLSVRIPPLDAIAFGVLSPPHDGIPLSLLVIVGATFPPPGIQIGFGFAITGVGGVVGINRRIDRDALLRAITDGTAAQLLFPADPVAAGEAAIRALPAVFPPAQGSFVAGPMFELAWGGARLISLSVAVLVESARQVRLAILGKLVVALPHPQLPLVFLQATFTGIIDPGEPSAMFVASLTGSHILGASLSGDVLLLARGGDDPAMVVSAGGFHPSFRPPRGVPALRRMSVDLCPLGVLQLRCEAYFALTSNTVQFGARLELVAEVAGCGLRGFLGFDALIQFSPFRFIADVAGGIALRVFGETLLGISLALHLEGPAPYLARGRGSLDLFLFEVSFDFEFGWGERPKTLPPPPGVGNDLRTALSDVASWRATGAAPAGVTLTPEAARRLAAGAVVDPGGKVSVHQEVVPLGVEINRYQGVPVPPQRWDLADGEFAAGQPAAWEREVRGRFAPGQFLAPGSDDEALGADAFVEFRNGVELVPTAPPALALRPVTLGWQDEVITDNRPEPAPAALPAVSEEVEYLLSAASATDPGWWTAPEEVVTVAAAVPVAAAFEWSMAQAPVEEAATSVELSQSLRGTAGMVVVERWEVP
jgi:hypothetical protein